MATRKQVYLLAVGSRAGATIAVGAQCSTTCSLYGVTRSATGWQPLRLPASGNGHDIGVGGLLITEAKTVLVVGSSNADHDRSPRIWRASDGHTFSSVPLTAPRAAAKTRRRGDFRRRHRYLVVGSSAGLPVVWTSSDGAHYGSPTVLSRDRANSAQTITHGPAGWLVTGARSVGEQTEALVWTSIDGRHWTQQPPAVFGRATTYANSAIYGATAYHGWLVVGESKINGDDQSATAFRSADGRTWHAGVGAARDDLGGNAIGTREMNGVTVVGSGLVAAGWAETSRDSTGYAPAV